MKIVFSTIAVIITLYLLVMALLYVFQRTLLFPVVSEATGVNREVVVFKNEGIDLHGWILNKGQSKAIIYFGGNSEQIADNVDLFEDVLAPYSIYLVNYRGYGKSMGSPTERGLFSDALFIYDQIKPQYQSISVIGRSLGSGVAVYLGANRDIEKMALLTPYDSIAEVAQSHYPMFPTRYLVRDQFESAKYAVDITAPVLIMVVGYDPVVPAIHTDRLRHRLVNTKVSYQRIENVTHNNVDSSHEYRTALAAFF